MEMTDQEVKLPTTVDELDSFVASITRDFSLPEGDDTYDAIATMIMHLDHRIAHMKPSYFGNGVLKMMANKAAYTRLRELAEKRNARAEAEKAALTLVKDEGASVGSEPLQNA